MLQGRKLSYGYDNMGNQATRTVPNATDKSWTQTWDYENRLVKVEKIKGAERRTITFTYDPLGRRIGKQLETVIAGITKTSSWTYVYDEDSVALEIYTDENNTVTKTFYTQGAGIDEHLALERNGSFYYYHADGLGSTVSITDQSGNVVQTYEYDSFGMLKPSTAFRNSYTYTGREWDKEAGLYYYRARYYDPMEGRFISKDPIGFEGGDLNLYGYVHNNPINYIDPTGELMFSLSKRVWKKIIDKHIIGSKPGGTIFSEEASTVKKIIRETISSGDVYEKGGKYGTEYLKDFKRPIGTKGETIAKVAVKDGSIRTAYPILGASILGILTLLDPFDAIAGDLAEIDEIDKIKRYNGKSCQ